jgi:hypothetical protein
MTVGLIRTARAHHHHVPGEKISTQRPDTFAQTVTRSKHFLLAVERRTIQSVNLSTHFEVPPRSLSIPLQPLFPRKLLNQRET